MRRIVRVLAVLAAFFQLSCTQEEGTSATAESAPGGGTVSTEADPGPREDPPPISGGTLALTADGAYAVAGDPDNDLIFVVDVEHALVHHTLKLARGEEPGRTAIDASDQAHVVLRGSGQVMTFPVRGTGSPIRRDVCPAPRGIAVDEAHGVIHVACATGEWVQLSAKGSNVLRTAFLEPDLRDVVVGSDGLYVSTFRSAQVMKVEADGTIASRMLPAALVSTRPDGTVTRFEPSVAWRMAPSPSGGFVLLHQEADADPIDLTAGSSSASNGEPKPSSPYGGAAGAPCGSILHGAMSIQIGGVLRTTGFGAALPVDVAVSKSSQVAIAAAGMQSVLLSATFQSGSCATLKPLQEFASEPTSVAWTPQEEVVVLTRNPTTLWLPTSSVQLSDRVVKNAGHALFHRAPSSDVTLACASCHPEATEDGRVWNFKGRGPRRTQTVAGGISGTAPFHWDGTLSDMGQLLDEVLVRRMGGVKPTSEETKHLLRWLDSVPAPSYARHTTSDAIARGQALFNAAEVGCATCHSGPALTNNSTVDVGTGGKFQVPSLRAVSARAPFMHDGCAKTLRDRFGACGGGDQHGHTSQLTAGQIDDLVAYLQSL